MGSIARVPSQSRGGVRPSKVESGLNRLLSACPWVGHFISLSLGFLSRKTGLIIVSTLKDFLVLRAVLTGQCCPLVLSREGCGKGIPEIHPNSLPAFATPLSRPRAVSAHHELQFLIHKGA